MLISNLPGAKIIFPTYIVYYTNSLYILETRKIAVQYYKSNKGYPVKSCINIHVHFTNSTIYNIINKGHKLGLECTSYKQYNIINTTTKVTLPKLE